MNKILSTIFAMLFLGTLVAGVAHPERADRVVARMFSSLSPLYSSSYEPLPLGTEEETSIVTHFLTARSIGAKALQTEDQEILSTNNIIDATNKERIKAGLSPLVMNQKLVNSAIIKTQDMISRQYFEHLSPTGESVSDLGSRVGYDYIIMGENLALGNFISGDDVVEAWMKSPGHRANILNDKYQEIGVYAQKDTYLGREVWFAVQHFGTTRNNCPVITTSLKTAIDQLNRELRQQQALIAAEKNILESPERPKGEEYQQRVSDFNAMVVTYNTKLIISQEKIKQYNAQVSAFNSCLLKYQTK